MYLIAKVKNLTLLTTTHNSTCFDLAFYIFVIICIFLAFTIILKKRSEAKLKKTNSELLAALRKADEANAAKSDFLSRMSHDIRTPMNAIIGLTNLAKDVPGNPNETCEYLNEINSSGEFMLCLINDVLDMSRIERGSIKLSEEIVEYDDFIKSIYSIIIPLAQTKSINLILKNSGISPVPTVLMDKLRSTQIIMNIVTNAIKFTPNGGNVTLEIDNYSIIHDKLLTRITISDTGVGMSKEFMSHLYEPFAQEKNEFSEESIGTGLGLSIVKNLVELMGGTIKVNSTLAVGSTFTIELTYPITQSISSASFSVKEDNSYILDKRKILLAEDHPLNTKIATKLLEKKGISVTHATNGKEALETFIDSQEGYFDAIITDIRMPIMDGLEEAYAIRNLPRADAHSIPIIAMTANAYNMDVNKSKSVGMNAHLSKPIDPKILYATLIDSISKYRKLDIS